MRYLLIVEKSQNWPISGLDAEVVFARNYLTREEYSRLRGVRVINLCRSYRYQSVGYYVSLLAEARGHKPFPSISTIQDLKSMTLVRFASDELEDLIQHSLAPLKSDTFELSVYFGDNMAKRYELLSSRLFELFRAPLLRASFVRRDGEWELQNIKPIAGNDVPFEHLPFLFRSAEGYLAHRPRLRQRRSARYDIAILHNPEEPHPPSNQLALKHFVKAAESLELEAEMITREDYDRLAEFDAVFIRETTSVNHHTYRIARKAAAEGLVVVDDPESILRCTNKVYLAELMEHHRIPAPRTIVAYRENIEAVAAQLGFPCIIKQPDSSFSLGVFKVDSFDELQSSAGRLLDKSEYIIAQEFIPTEFDWRVGVLAGQPLYACKYYMASKHWQIAKHASSGNTDYGRVETVDIFATPPRIVRTAVEAAKLIGDGLYGVDLKQLGKRCLVMEVNENPNIDAGYEDAVLKDELYQRIMRYFLARIESRKTGHSFK